jgi:carboxypeptidase C (cathepsin A)
MFSKVALACLAGAAQAAVPSDKITSLPGWPQSEQVPTMYSGYLPVGKTSGTPGHIHYWFIEAETDPANSPVVYWTNGGPGGSGINAGLLSEMGRVHLNENSEVNGTASPTLIDNPYAWSKVANTLYVSQPKGVGFSYCDDLTVECANNDKVAAEDFYDFAVAFFEAYPEYKQNDFFLTAESYGGIYIPTFMREIMNRGGVDNLKGAAIGDGCWGTKIGMCNFETGVNKRINTEFFQGHGMYSQTLYADIKAACGNFSDADVLEPKCAGLLSQMNTDIGQFDIYNIYDTCGEDDLSLHEYAEKLGARRVEVKDATSPLAHPQLKSAKLAGAVNDYACGGNAISDWLSQDSVVKALHVKTGTRGMNYTWGPDDFSGDLRPTYKDLIAKYRILIYSGDTDACIPQYGSEEWTRELGYPVKKPWRPWMSPHLSRKGEQRAGYVIDYDTPTNFKFVTIQGAGHLVPMYKPHFALTMITKFINNEEF